jgi:metal-responsive CopG/Arc/MetJ family transcriptional regulator
MDTLYVAVRPVQISLDEDLLRRIDRDPEAKQKGRSAFIRAATELYLQAKERKGIDDAIRRAYRGKADDLLSEVEDLLGAQAWPDE